MPRTLLAVLLLFCSLPAANAQVDSADGMKLDFGFTRGKNVYLWPIIRRIKEDKVRDLQLAFTLYQNKRKFTDSSHHSHLLPIYWTDSNSRGKDFRLFTTYYPSVFRANNNFKNGVKSYAFMEFAPGINLLEFSKSKSGDYLSNNLFFFLWYKNDKIKQQGYFVTFPVYWHFHTAQKSQSVLFPVYWHTHTAQKKHNVLFPLYWQYRNGNKRSNVLFPVYWQFRDSLRNSSTLFPLYSYGSNRYKDKKYFAITPLFWHVDKGSNGSKTRLFPLYYRNVYKADSSTGIQNILFPVYWSYRDANYNNKVFFPFIWSYRNDKYHSFTAFPLMSYGVSADKKRSYEIITPLYGRFKSPEKQSKWFIPLFYQRVEYNHSLFRGDMQFPDTHRITYIFPFYKSYVSSKEIHRSLLPIYWRHKNSYDNDYVIFPFIWKYDDNTSKSFALMPFFASGRQKDGSKSFYAISFIYWHTTLNSSYRKGYRNTFFPIWWQGEIRNYNLIRKPYNMSAYKYHVLFPVWWHFKDTAKGRSSSVLFPLIWSIKRPNSSSFAFMPFFSQGKSKNGSHFAITPLFWHFSTRSKQFDFLFPVWWHFKDTERHRRADVLFPLVWNFRKPSHSSFTFVPFFSWRKSKDGRGNNHLVVTPLFWQFRNQTKYSNYVFPLWWYRYNKNEDKLSNIIFPVWWYVKTPGKTSVTLFPVYWHRRIGSPQYGKHTNILFPLFFEYDNNYSKRKGTVLFPFYWKLKSEHDTNTVIFPFSYYSRSNWRSCYVLFPLFINYNYYNTYKLQAFTPLYWHYKSKDKAVGMLFPLYFYNRKTVQGEAHRKSVFFPVYFRKVTPHETNTVVFPFSFSYRDKRRLSYTLFPLFAWRQNLLNDNRYYAVTPLFWNVRQNGAHAVHFFPLFHYKSDSLQRSKAFSLFYILYRQQKSPEQKHFSVLWPLLDYYKDKSSRSFRIVPLVWYKKSDSLSYKAFIPVYYVGHVPGHRQINLFWQLYTQRYDTGSAKKTSYLFKAFIANRYKNNDYEYRFLYLVYAKMKKEGKREFSLFPFYYSRSDSSTGNYNRSVFLSIYSRFKVAIPGTTYSYKEEKILWFIRLRSNYKYLKSKGINYQR